MARRSVQPAELAAALPLQIIDADIGGVVRGSPEGRRRLLDWGVFHVKHDYLRRWRRFRQGLVQRNAALRGHAPDDMLEAWETELAEAAAELHVDREDYVGALSRGFEPLAERLVGARVGIRCIRGWTEDQDLATVLRAGREGDRKAGYTRAGPHRADLQLEMQSQRPRWIASRGEQKLLGAALVLAQCELAASSLGRTITLLVDEPGAELDGSHRKELMRAILESPAQVFLAAIGVEGLPLESESAMFHVEHGSAKALL
jgi:DNA replication and repair protein RecF